MAWSLENALQIHSDNPYTFYIPSKHVTDQLRSGHMVKLIFLPEKKYEGYNGERMWVEITRREEDQFTGILQNEPYFMKELSYGQEINFQVEHICDTQLNDPSSSNWDFYFEKKAIVSKDVLERREFNFMLRDQPHAENDIGWTFFTGYEEEEFNSNSDNFQVISIGALLNMDDSILSFIHEKPLCAFNRDIESRKFVKVEDYDWDSYLQE